MQVVKFDPKLSTLIIKGRQTVAHTHTEQTLAEALREEFHLDETGTLSENILGGVLAEDQRWLTPEEIHEIISEAGEHWITKDGRRIAIGGNGPHTGKHIMVGIAPYRAHNVDSIDKVPALFNDAKSQAFEKQIPEIAKEFPGVNVAQVRRSAGVWQSSREASFIVTGSTTDQAALDAYSAKLGDTAPEKQMAVVAFTEDQAGKGFAYQLLGVKNQEAAISTLLKHGFEGAAVPLGQGKIILFDQNGSLRGNMKKASEELHLRYSKTRGDVHFIGEGDYAKIQSQYSKTKAEGEEIHYRDPAYLQEAGDGEEITEALMDEQTEMLLQIAEAAGGGQLVWITKNGNRIPLGGQSTTAQQFRSSSGKWRADRVAIADKAAFGVTAGKMAPVGRKPIANVMGGGTGVGKSTVEKMLIAEDLNLANINADNFKLPIPEYAHYKIVDPENAAHLVHDESKMITQRVLAEATGRGLDFTYDATTAGTSGPELIHSLFKQGYDVRAFFVDIPEKMAVARAKWRAENSSDPANIGRYVPPGVIHTTHLGSAGNFFILKDNPELTSIKLYDNSVKGPPRLIYQRTNVNGHLGQEKIYDKARFRQYSRKSVGLSEAAKKVRFIQPGCLPDTSRHFGFRENGRNGESENSEGKGIAELILETQALLEGVKASLQLLTD
jgi:predicted ABC-type ATPase